MTARYRLILVMACVLAAFAACFAEHMQAAWAFMGFALGAQLVGMADSLRSAK